MLSLFVKAARFKMADTLVWAVKNGDLEQVKALVVEGTNLNEELMNGRMALHYAADYGQTEVIAFLVSKGANVNLPDKHGITPLLAAIYEGHIDSVRFLLEKGADKSGKRSRWTVLYRLCRDCRYKEAA